MLDIKTSGETLTSKTPFWPWLIAAGIAGWLVWPSAFQAATALSVFGYRTFQQDVFEENSLVFSMTVARTLGPFIIFWAVCNALRELTSIWQFRISTQVMIAALITTAALGILGKVGLYNVTGVEGWLFVQILAFLPATILGGIFGGIALVILRRMKAKHLLTFMGVGCGVGVLLGLAFNFLSVIANNPINKIIQSTLSGVGFWGVGGALALCLVWFWWQTLEILRLQDGSNIR